MAQQWEYIIVKIEGGGQNGLNEGLNKMGEQGFEAWHLEDRPDHALVFLKRLKSAPIMLADPSQGQFKIGNGRSRG